MLVVLMTQLPPPIKRKSLIYKEKSHDKVAFFISIHISIHTLNRDALRVLESD